MGDEPSFSGPSFRPHGAARPDGCPCSAQTFELLTVEGRCHAEITTVTHTPPWFESSSGCRCGSLIVGWFFHQAKTRTDLLILAAISLMGALVLTLSTDDNRSSGASCTVQFSVPFQGLDTLANVAMLIPLSLFLGLATRRPLLTLAGVSGLSAFLELVQALIPALGRSCDTNDWFMNIVGGLLGVLGAVSITALDRRRRRSGDH